MNRIVNTTFLKVASKMNDFENKITGLFRDNKGEGFVDTALKILISVVIGGLLLGGLYMLFKDTVLPTLTQKITEMFNFKG